MSQRAVERALGKLLTDEAFREAFGRDPGEAGFRAGLDLSPDEIDALRRIPAPALAWFSAVLDDRICRLCVCRESAREESER